MNMTSLLTAHPVNPFGIGLKPLTPDQFIQIDEDFLPFRNAKRELYCVQFDDVCMAEPNTLDAQREVQSLIFDNLKRHHKSVYDFNGSEAACGATSERFDLETNSPLASTALLIPEDLILMRRDDSGWRLVAASLSFPSSWNLQEKFSKPLESVHGPVPLSKKMSLRINRIFDALQPFTPLWRTNWALVDDGELRHDRTENQPRLSQEKSAETTFLRTEFQTLHKLPVSKDILFTVRIKTRPIDAVSKSEDGREKLKTLHDQYLAMTDEERRYKGMDHHAQSLINWLASH